jgi:DNA-binding MarR family transcriptional regulator
LLEQILPQHEFIARLIGLARRRLKQAVGRRSAQFDLSPQQFWVIVFLRSTEGPALSELVAHTRIDAPPASRIVTTLMRRRLVRVKADARDRRRTRLHLTARGQAMARDLQPLADEVRNVAERDLSRREAGELRRLLLKVIASLDRNQEEGDVA